MKRFLMLILSLLCFNSVFGEFGCKPLVCKQGYHRFCNFPKRIGKIPRMKEPCSYLSYCKCVPNSNWFTKKQFPEF